MKETGIRLLSGLVYVGIVVALAFVNPIWSVFFFLLIAMQCAREFGQLFWKKSNGRVEVLVYFTASLYAALAAPIAIPSITIWKAMLLPGLVFLISMIVVLKRSSDVRSAVSGVMMGAPIIAVSFAVLAHLRAAGFELFLGMFILLWSTDTFAYIWGRLIGRHKLMPNISPGKTIEGFIGAVISTVGLAILISKYWPIMQSWQWICAAVFIALFGAIGDLMESALKRQAGVKDSGKIMPGHGGILDRFDAMLLAAPIYFALLKGLEVF